MKLQQKNRVPSGLANPMPALGVVMVGSLMTSSSSIWIRFLIDIHPVIIGFVRVAGASIIFLPWFWRSLISHQFALRDFRYSVLAGIALALHFATWIASLSYTTVAQSVLFVATHPMFVIVISLTVLRIAVARNQIIGAMLAFAGIVFIQWWELELTVEGNLMSGNTGGNLLALAGGLFAAIYLLFSREARRSLSTLVHVEVTYATAAIVMLVLSLLLPEPTLPSQGKHWLYLILLILLPTVGGHTIFNWGLKHLGTPIISMMGLLEPIEAALLALIVLGEKMSIHTILGGAVIILGLALAVWRRSSTGALLPTS